MDKNILNQIDDLKSKLAGLRPLSKSAVRRLTDDFIIENTYNTNAIEGSSLTLRETYLILKDGFTVGGKLVREHLEAVGHRDAFYYMMNIVDNKAALTERIIKEIHALILVNDPQAKGRYRYEHVGIRGARNPLTLPHLIPEEMEKLMADYATMKQKKHVIEAIAEFHLRFEGIHPFIDGNGRTGRLIINFELMKAGLLPIDIKFTDRDRYYRAFDAYYGDDKSPGPMTEIIANYELEELTKYVEMVEYANAMEARENAKTPSVS